jgi:hypothetical protein|tara:strand:- start:106 stop:270 length:165 start_codon:yes stop_codon:yes gene_type:complete
MHNELYESIILTLSPASSGLMNLNIVEPQMALKDLTPVKRSKNKGKKQIMYLML